MIDSSLVQEIKALRSQLHACPELAFEEKQTKALLMTFIREHTSLELVDMGPCFYARKTGAGENCVKLPIGFRADFDAVAGKDGTPGHYCGHDGHASILAGFAVILDEIELDRDVYLFFQPAEEIGQGGPLFEALLEEMHIGEVYGFHNIPGYPEGAILFRNGTFACGSTGLELTFLGKPSHAAYPESGVNPGNGILKVLQYVTTRIKEPSEGMILATLIGIDAGSKAYGVSASSATIRYTIRGEKEEEFQKLVHDILSACEQFAKEEGLEYSWKGIEAFPATENNDDSTGKLRVAAKEAGLQTVELPDPFRWSEDFGYYLRHCKGAMFGAGAGENHPDLHTESYTFNDIIIPAVLAVYKNLLELS